MSADARSNRYRSLAALAMAAATLCAATIPLSPARAQPYLGWDFGNGFGIGIGPPPSAYTRCPDYGWGPFYPYRCRYYGYYGPHRVTHRAHVKRTPQTAWRPPQ